MAGNSLERAAGAGAWVSAGGVLATWACCSLPLAGGALGVGVGAVGEALTPWRPYLIGLSFVLALLSVGMAYRPQAACGGACAVPERRTRQRWLAWGLLGATVIIATLPLWQLLVAAA